jgi:hypothetical protein
MATIKVCDVCGSSEDVNTREYVIGQTYNSIDYDDVAECFDLCLKCETVVLNRTINSLSNTFDYKCEINKNIVSVIKKLQG